MSKVTIIGALALALAACKGDAKELESAAEARKSGGGTSSQAPGAYALASGTVVNATIQDSLSSQINKPDESVRTTVSANVVDARGNVVIPAGSALILTIEKLESASDQLRQGQLILKVATVTVRDTAHSVSATLAPVPHTLRARGAYRDVIVTAGTPIIITLTQPLSFTAR